MNMIIECNKNKSPILLPYEEKEQALTPCFKSSNEEIGYAHEKKEK